MAGTASAAPLSTAGGGRRGPPPPAVVQGALSRRKAPGSWRCRLFPSELSVSETLLTAHGPPPVVRGREFGPIARSSGRNHCVNHGSRRVGAGGAPPMRSRVTWSRQTALRPLSRRGRLRERLYGREAASREHDRPPRRARA